jgi:hypothetical protein
VAEELAGLAPPSDVEEVWLGDFSYLHANCPSSLLNLTMHPQAIVRGHRMLMLERLVRYFASHAGMHARNLRQTLESIKSLL